MHAGREHYDFFHKGESESDIRAFNAMFDRFQAAEAAGKAAIAGVATQQVSAGAKAGQATAGAGSGPSGSSTSAEAAAIARKKVTAGAGANQGTAGVANVRASGPTPLPGSSFTPPTTPEGRQLSVIAEMLREQRDSIASIQQNQEALTSAVASLQQNQEALATSVQSILSTVHQVQSETRTIAGELAKVRTQAFETIPQRLEDGLRQQQLLQEDSLRQQQLLRRDLGTAQRQLDKLQDELQNRETPPPVPTDPLIDLVAPPLHDSSAIRHPCQKTIDLFAAFSGLELVPAQVPPSDYPPPDSGPVFPETPEPSQPTPVTTLPVDTPSDLPNQPQPNVGATPSPTPPPAALPSPTSVARPPQPHSPPSDPGPVSSETPETSTPAPPPPPWPPPSPSATSPTSVAQPPTPGPSSALAAVLRGGSWGSGSSDDDAPHCGSERAIARSPSPPSASLSRPIDDG